jgi:hypothetical protein
MTRAPATVLMFAVLAAAPAHAEDAGDLRATYQTYAAGLHVASAEAHIGLGPWSYQMHLAYHTTGLVGLFYQGHQVNTVTGTWVDDGPVPRAFIGEGMWRGEPRATWIDYDHGRPLISLLVPPNEIDRQPVPPDLQVHTVDYMSALMGLMRNVATSARCEGATRLYDGRRLTEAAARTMGVETLAPTARSMFSGKALRCDFEGHMLAGFLSTDHDERRWAPLHGSVWLALVVPGTTPIPVQMTYETRWFGTATMYLTEAAQGESRQQAAN